MRRTTILRSAGAGGGGGPTFEDNETPAGAINGVNLIFTLAFSPSPGSSLILYLNGLLQRSTDEYSLAVATITMVLAPETGDNLRGWYRR